MSEQNIIVDIHGYWRETEKINLHHHGGIFFVYEAHHYLMDNTIDLLRLLFIEEVEDLQTNFRNQERFGHLKEFLSPTNELCFATAFVAEQFRTRATLAYILTHLPPANTNRLSHFPYETTTIISTGKTALLQPVITIKKTNGNHAQVPLSFQSGKIIPVRGIMMGR